MGVRSASIQKLGAVLDLLAADPALAEGVQQDPDAAMRQAGLDLAPDELAAVGDIVRGASNSRYAGPQPSRIQDAFPALRDKWARIKKISP